MKTRLVLAAAFAAAMSGPAAMADVLYLTNGEKQEGIITQDLPQSKTVRILTTKGELAVPRSKISRVERLPEAASLAAMGDQQLKAGDAKAAGELYEKALKLTPNDPALQQKVAQARDAVAARATVTSDAEAGKVDKNMEEARKLAAEKKYEEAAKLLDAAVPAQSSPQWEAYSKTASEVFAAWGISRADHQDVPGASAQLEKALRFNPANAEARARIAKLWEADPTKADKVAQFYKDDKTPEGELKYADALYRQKDYVQALPIYLKYANDPNLGSDTIRKRVSLMFDMAHRQLAEKGDYEGAYKVYAQFMQFSPSESQLPLAKYEYMLRRAATDLNDPAARAELAKFAAERGMPEVAKQEFANVLTMAPDNKTARDGLRAFADADMQDARDFFAAGQYPLAVQKARDVASAYPIFPDLTKEAGELVTKAGVELQKKQQNAQQQAVALALRGDDYYNQALSYLSAFMSKDRNTNVRVFSPKEEAKKNLQRAVYSWQAALKLDASLGAPTSYDLSRKISDASSKLAVIANPNPPPLPPRSNYRSQRASDD